MLITADELGLSEGEFPRRPSPTAASTTTWACVHSICWERFQPPFDLIFASDVGKAFRVVRPKPLGMISRSMRAADILWDRAGRLEKQNFESDHRFLFLPAMLIAARTSPYTLQEVHREIASLPARHLLTPR